MNDILVIISSYTHVRNYYHAKSSPHISSKTKSLT